MTVDFADTRVSKTQKAQTIREFLVDRPIVLYGPPNLLPDLKFSELANLLARSLSLPCSTYGDMLEKVANIENLSFYDKLNHPESINVEKEMRDLLNRYELRVIAGITGGIMSHFSLHGRRHMRIEVQPPEMYGKNGRVNIYRNKKDECELIHQDTEAIRRMFSIYPVAVLPGVRATITIKVIAGSCTESVREEIIRKMYEVAQKEAAQKK